MIDGREQSLGDERKACKVCNVHHQNASFMIERDENLIPDFVCVERKLELNS